MPTLRYLPCLGLLLGLHASLQASPAAAVNQALGTEESGTLQAGDFSFTRLENGVRLKVRGVTREIVFYGPELVRVGAHLGEIFTRQPSLAIIAQPSAVDFTLTESPEALSIASPQLRIIASKKSGALSFLRPDGSTLTRENQERPCELNKISVSGQPSYALKHAFSPSLDESLYGLGQYNTPYMDYRGREVLLVQTNIGSVVPMLLSTRRYGLLWDVYSKMHFKDDARGAVFEAESAPAGSDYYFIAGESMDAVIGGYRTLTGKAPLFPKAALGLFMSKERYKTQEQLIEVVRRFRSEQFPLDYIVQDWQYWGGSDDGTWSGMIWDKQRFPDPAGMARCLHDELHVKLMASIWPSVGNDTELARELDSKGLRFAPLHWISKKARIYDAFSEEGRAIYFKHIKSGLLDVGVDALWMDGTEVEVGGACHDAAEVEADIKGLGSNALGDFTRYLNPYSLVTTRGTYEGQRATSNKRVLTLTRSAWAGQQRYAAMPWSGDTTASWETFRNQISGGLNIAMAGLPYWTQDTGGFFVNSPGGERNPAYRELFARWNQFGIFNPIYRIHGTNIEREPYHFKTLDPEIYRSVLEAAQLRYRLLPYLYSLAWKSTSEGYTMMRGLPMDFPDEARLRKIDDTYLFGPALLVHPVTRPMYHIENPPAPTIPTDCLRSPLGQPGLAVEYYSDTQLTHPASRSIDPKVDHTWPGPPLANPPAGLDKLTHFSARWEGELLPQEDGLHEIGLEGDDGYRLWLNGSLLVEDWAHGPARYKGATVQLKKDQKVSLKIEYFQGASARSLRLSWRTPAELRRLAGEKRALDLTMRTELPSGCAWYDFWTNQRFEGGRQVSGEFPLNTLPLYVRAGSILPLGPVMQYATEQPDAPYEIRIYPGADASFTLYEDDNETYNYEKGEHATCELRWHEASRTLTVGERRGSFPGMTTSRQLRIVLAEPGHNAGAGEARHQARLLTYTGGKMSVRLD